MDKQSNTSPPVVVDSDDDVSLIELQDRAAAPSPPKRRLARVVGIAAVAVALCAGIAIAVLLAGTRRSGVVIPDRFTANYVAYSKTNDSGEPLVTGTVFRRRAASGSRFGWHVRGTATMSAAGGTRVMTATVVDDQGIVQVHDDAQLESERELISTKCANNDRFPSLASVGDAIEAGHEIDEAAMVATVGKGACEGDQWTRFLVQVGQVPFVVCWTSGFAEVQVAGQDFYAVLDVSRDVDEAKMNAIALPEDPATGVLDCPLLDQALFNVASSRRLRQPAVGDGARRDAQGRRLCEDCDPFTFPPGENCCRRRLDGTTEVVPLSPEQQQTHNVDRRRLGHGANKCLATGAPQKKCVFVHGLGVRAASDATSTYREYWGDVHRFVEPHCESVHFIHYKTYHTSPLDAAASMCSALTAVGGDDLDNLILFVHGAGNLILGHAADVQLCKPGDGSYWFEVQSGRHLSALADWGKHFCQAESAPTLTRLLGASNGQGLENGLGHTEPFNKFVETYPFCSADDGRRLAVGGGSLAVEWQFLDGDENVDYERIAASIHAHVSGSMCSVKPSNAAPSVRYEGILVNAWDKIYLKYPHLWSRCWSETVLGTSYTDEDYAASMSMYDITCRSGNAWYAQQPSEHQPCKWYAEIACKYGRLQE